MSELIRSFLEKHLQNQVFAGGLGLGLIGGLTASLTYMPKRLRWFFRRYCTVTVQIDSQSELFNHVMAWLNAHPYAGSCRRLSARLVDGADGQDAIQFLPAEGWHWFFHARRLIWLTRDDVGMQSGGAITGPMRVEKITLRMIGRQTNTIRKIIEQVTVKYGKPDPDYMKVYAITSYDEWQRVSRVRKRSLKSVILKESLIDDIVLDMRRFLEAEAWYAERGVPWRRGYLLHGPPGTGKTSLIRALAGHFDRDLALMNLASERLDDIKLGTLLADVPDHCIIVLEDIDAAFVGRTGVNAAKGITFSGLLNALDGILSQEGRVLFMTTNHPERLDPALVRPGRADRKFELGLATRSQIVQHFKMYYPEASSEEAEDFARQFGSAPATPAMIQEVLLNRMTATGNTDQLASIFAAIAAE